MADENKVVITYTTIDELVRKIGDNDPDVAYVFNAESMNRRQFRDTGSRGGIYAIQDLYVTDHYVADGYVQA